MQTGLIVVDLQKAFSPPQDMVDKITALRGAYDIVIATQFINPPSGRFETILNYTRCRLGTPDTDIVIPLSPQHIFDRFSYGLQPQHVEVLKQYPVKSWDIVGCDTDACVLATCYALWDNNIDFRVLKELCYSSGGAALHRAALAIIERSFGQ